MKKKIPIIFSIPYLGSSSSNRSSPAVGFSWWNTIPSSSSDQVLRTRGINSLKIVAGPKRKTFIRRFNRNKSGLGSSKSSKFQYDPLSYALNFDEGPGQKGYSDQADDYLFRNFVRYGSGVGKRIHGNR